MNLKRCFSCWLLVISFIFVITGSSFAGLGSISATSSNAVKGRSAISTFASTEGYSVSAKVNGTYQMLTMSDSRSYYLPKGTTEYRVELPPGLGVSFSNAEYVRGMTVGYLINGKYSFVTGYPYSQNIYNDRIYMYNPNSTFMTVYVFVRQDQISIVQGVLKSDVTGLGNLPRSKIGGIYTSSDLDVRLETSFSPYSGSQLNLFTPYGYSDNNFVNYFFGTSDGILKKGYEYTFNFYSTYGSGLLYNLRTRSSNSSLASGVVDGTNVSFTFVANRDYRLDELFFFVRTNSVSDPGAFFYLNSSSTYIPAANTGEQGQQIANNTTIIKNVVTNIQNTVSNISNQITNMTTTITNTINNAVSSAASQITGSVNQASNNITSSVKQASDKISGAVDKSADKITQNANDNTKKVTDKLEDVKNGIISGIIDGLKGLFIPSDEYFKSYFDDLNAFFSDKLGFLYVPVDLFIRLCDLFLSAGSGSTSLTLPGFEIMGEQVWPDIAFDLGAFLKRDFGELMTVVHFATSCLMVFGFLDLLWHKYEEVFGHDSGGSA